MDGRSRSVVASAGWALTSERVNRSPEGLDLPGLLDVIEAEMKDAPERLQWAMNETLASIGIENPDLRDRALDIGERLEVLKDYPTPPNCTSPFAPIWITEIVRRREEADTRPVRMPASSAGDLLHVLARGSSTAGDLPQGLDVAVEAADPVLRDRDPRAGSFADIALRDGDQPGLLERGHMP